MAFAPGIRTMIDDPGMVTSGFSVLGITSRARIPTMVTKMKIIHVNAVLFIASFGNFMGTVLIF